MTACLTDPPTATSVENIVAGGENCGANLPSPNGYGVIFGYISHFPLAIALSYVSPVSHPNMLHLPYPKQDFPACCSLAGLFPILGVEAYNERQSSIGTRPKLKISRLNFHDLKC